jgi:hypothetical protein
MKLAEQAAFVEAYATSVADVPSGRVAEFVRRYYELQDMDYSSDYTSIVDALGMWNAGIKWQMEQTQHHPECPAVDGFGCRCEELKA